MKNKLFSLVLITLFILGIGIFVLPQAEASIQERRELSRNDDISLSNIVKTSENVLNDQFYFRDKIVKAYYYINTTLSSKFGINIIDDIEATQLTDEIVLLNDDYLSNNALSYTDEELKLATSRGFNINEFDLKYPSVKTYVYKCTRIEELFNTNYPYQERCWEDMIYQFNPDISYSKLGINNMKDFQNYYYKTDRHWNARGAYQGYVDIINMIDEDFDIGDPKEIKEYIVYPYEFKGSTAGKIALLGDHEHLTDCILEDIGDFDYYINNEPCNFYAERNEYINNGNKTPYTDYEYYYGTNTLLKLFDFKQENKPNLLIFSTSFANGNNLWIASHFNKTLLIDLRSKEEDFSLEYYIDKYDINVALLETSYDTLFLNGYMYIPLD